MLNNLINEYYDILNENDLHFLNYVIYNVDTVLKSTLAQLSSLCNLSSSTISRTTQKLGFDGFTQFKYFLVSERENVALERKVNTGVYKSSILLDDVSQTIKFFEQNKFLENIYELMLKSKRIFAYGTGHSQRLMIAEFSRCLLANDLFINSIPSETELETIKDNLNENDVLFVVGLSGNIDPIKSTLKELIIKQVPIISVTKFGKNELAYMADYSLYYQLTNYNPSRKMSTSSFLTLNLILALVYEGLTNYIALDKSSDT